MQRPLVTSRAYPVITFLLPMSEQASTYNMFCTRCDYKAKSAHTQPTVRQLTCLELEQHYSSLQDLNKKDNKQTWSQSSPVCGSHPHAEHSYGVAGQNIIATLSRKAEWPAFVIGCDVKHGQKRYTQLDGSELLISRFQCWCNGVLHNYSSGV